MLYGQGLMENRQGLLVDACLTLADGHAERVAKPDRSRGDDGQGDLVRQARSWEELSQGRSTDCDASLY